MFGRKEKEREAAFLTFLLDHEASLYRFVYGYVKDEALAKDVIQDSIRKGLLHLPDLKDMRAVKSWFYTILRFTAIDAIRKQKQMMEHGESELEAYHDDSLPMEDRLALKEALQKIDPQQKEIIVLKFFEGFTFLEISELLQVNVSTIKNKYYQALRLMEAELS